MAPWKLLVWDPITTFSNQTEINARAVYTNADPGGIVGGFEWSIEKTGNCKQLRFSGSPMDRSGTARLNITARDIVRLQIDDDEDGTYTNTFAGVIVQNPAPRDTMVKEYVALGLKELFRLRSAGASRYATEQDVNEFVDDLQGGDWPTQVSYTKPAATGGVLNLFEAPGIKLTEALDALKNSVPGFDWGVDADAVFFFDTASGSTSVTYASSGLRWLPVASEEIATRVDILAVAQNRGPQSLERLIQKDAATVTDPRDAEYAPKTDIVSYSHADHGTYGAVNTFVSPVPSLKPIVPAFVTNTRMTNAGNAVDADKSTYANNDGTGKSTIAFQNAGGELLRGFTLKYRVLSSSVNAWVYIEHTGLGVTFQPIAKELFRLPATSEIQTIEVVFLTCHGLGAQDTANIVVGVDGGAAADTLRIYDFRALAVDSAALGEIAESLIRLPASEPASIDMSGYYPPTASITVTGAPGGNVTGDAERWTYTLTPGEGLRTRVASGQRSESEVVRTLRLEASSAAAAAKDSLRVYVERGQ